MVFAELFTIKSEVVVAGMEVDILKKLGLPRPKVEAYSERSEPIFPLGLAVD